MARRVQESPQPCSEGAQPWWDDDGWSNADEDLECAPDAEEIAEASCARHWRDEEDGLGMSGGASSKGLHRNRRGGPGNRARRPKGCSPKTGSELSSQVSESDASLCDSTPDRHTSSGLSGPDGCEKTTDMRKNTII